MSAKKILLIWVGLGLAACYSTKHCQAADWAFEQSYYTHPSSPGYRVETAPLSRSAYRKPYLNLHPRFAIRGGVRYNTFQLRNGNSYDQTIYREQFFDAAY